MERMEPCFETAGSAASEEASATPGRWTELQSRWIEVRERVDSEWSAAREALAGPEPARKWLGWALYRLATRVNPEISD
jgi:hypothetical protein